MNEREDFGQIVVAAFIGSMIGASLIIVGVGSVAVIFAQDDAEASWTLGIALFSLPFGWVIAALTAWPVGMVIGGLLSLSNPSTDARAVVSGCLTGFVLTAPLFLLNDRFPSAITPAEWLMVAAFTGVGAVSGWLAYRWVLRPGQAS